MLKEPHCSNTVAFRLRLLLPSGAAQTWWTRGDSNPFFLFAREAHSQLCYRPTWYAGWGSNPRHPPCKRGALAAELPAYKTKKGRYLSVRPSESLGLDSLSLPNHLRGTCYLPPPRQRQRRTRRRTRVQRWLRSSWRSGSSCLSHYNTYSTKISPRCQEKNSLSQPSVGMLKGYHNHRRLAETFSKNR